MLIISIKQITNHLVISNMLIILSIKKITDHSAVSILHLGLLCTHLR